MLVKEKEHTRARDALAAQPGGECRGCPVEKNYEFDGPDGTVSLLDLFEGRRQLIVYCAFLGPRRAWLARPRLCRLLVDGRSHRQPRTPERPRHHPRLRIPRFAGRTSHGSRPEWVGITPWYTIVPGPQGAFDVDFGVDQWHGTNAFIREGDRVFRTYFIESRGDEVFDNTFHFLDMTALGRQEVWRDSPEDYLQTKPYEWWRWHDDYGNREPPPPLGEVTYLTLACARLLTRAGLPGSIKTPERASPSLLSDLDDAALNTAVAACPGWSVGDVVAHLAAVADDFGRGTDEWPADRGRDGSADRPIRRPGHARHRPRPGPTRLHIWIIWPKARAWNRPSGTSPAMNTTCARRWAGRVRVTPTRSRLQLRPSAHQSADAGAAASDGGRRRVSQRSGERRRNTAMHNTIPRSAMANWPPQPSTARGDGLVG